MPTFQDCFEDGIRSWMKNSSSMFGPQNELAPFSHDPMYSNSWSSLSHREERLKNYNNLLTGALYTQPQMV